MEIRPLALRREIMKSFAEIEKQIEEVKKEAKTVGIEPHSLVDHDGRWVMIPLLAARVQLLHAITLLNQRGD